ncbi:hypothetical protein [uncultured Methanofollis sp.]|uniref:hypothetical protein n=1 Tax=uncultured Methanofollis sp. TaxID=262500 RepID=UPI00262D1A67|nr:hypothetical protein [uncultured Methanofollis sp.]
MDDGTIFIALGQIIVVLLALIGVGVAGCVLYLVRVQEQLVAIRKDSQERQQYTQLRNIVGGTAQTSVDMFQLFKHIQRSREVEWEKPPLNLDLFEGRADIAGSMQAMCEKYYLDAFTVATDDGLVVASSEDDASADAAKYSYLFTEGKLPDDPKVMLFGIQHKGSNLVGILRTEHNIPDAWVKDMESDAVSILRKWL